MSAVWRRTDLNILGNPVIFYEPARAQASQTSDIMPLLTDGDPLSVDGFATHTRLLEGAPHGRDIFQHTQDGAVKIVLEP